MRELTEEEFAATIREPRPIGPGDSPPCDFWPYFDAIPPEDFHGHDCSGCDIEHGWIMSPDGFEHVCVSSEDRNVFMVLVLDRRAKGVYGHRLLDLNREYGLDA